MFSLRNYFYSVYVLKYECITLDVPYTFHILIINILKKSSQLCKKKKKKCSDMNIYKCLLLFYYIKYFTKRENDCSEQMYNFGKTVLL